MNALLLIVLILTLLNIAIILFVYRQLQELLDKLSDCIDDYTQALCINADSIIELKQDLEEMTDND